MTFLWAGFLYLLVLIPIILIAYVWALRRGRRFAVHYSSLTLLDDIFPPRSRLRRHLPFGLFLMALTGLIAALSRPVSIVTVPTRQVTTILAIDVSRSMCSTDIQPTRLQAAEAAAITFIQHQKANTQLGIVAFSGFAELIQAPTADPQALQVAIRSLLTGGRTAIGSAILKSLDAISETDKRVAPSVSDASPEIAPTPVPKGAYAPDIIVLLTDGVSNMGLSPLAAAQQAADRGVRVYTIGFGTPNGSELASCQSSDPSRLGGSASGGGSGRSFRRGIDELTLTRIADMTGGVYYPASSASELERVFNSLPTYLIAKHETTEVSVIFVAGGALLAALGIALSFLWHPLP